MALEPGSRLGPYEIISPAGAGGMGEVWKARDTRLERTVALKVLPPDLTSHPAARQRFEREARAVAALSHPHICTLHDIGQQDGTDFLVMEYLDGDTLAQRLTRGKLPLDQALQYGIQIADALAAAHKAGIIHRDLKPGNIMLTKSGAKLLDFGLAKPREQAVVSGQTVTRFAEPLTGHGSILGTLQYMAPEQLEGNEADARTDIWAFGMVLYEMTTGTPPFSGGSQASLIGSILKDRPPSIRTAQPLAPNALDHVVTGCLEKDPDHRWQSARDAGRELRWIAQDGAPPLGTRSTAQSLFVAVTVAIALLALGGAVGWLAGARFQSLTDSRAHRAVRRLSIVLAQDAALAPTSATPFNYLRQSFAVSPDESQVVYVGRTRDGNSQLYLRRTDGYATAAIPGTEGGFDPFFSPDGRSIGFFTFDALLRISLNGGAPLTLTSVVNPVGGTWCDDGTIYFAADEGDELWQLAGGGATGQPPKRITISNMESAYPYCLPGSTGLLVTMTKDGTDRSARIPSPRPRLAPGIPLSADYATVGVLPLPVDKSSPRPLLPRGYAAQYASSGHLVFARSASLIAARFDRKELRVTGGEVTVLKDVRMNSVAVKAAQFTITGTGSLLYVRGGDHSRTELVWVDRHGKIERTAVVPNLFGALQLSPDGKRVVVEVGGIQNDIYVYALQDGRRIRVTTEGNGGRRAVWHPDGRRVVFRSDADERTLIKHVESDAAPEAFSAPDHIVSSWSAGGLIGGAYQDRIWIGSPERQTKITSAGRGRAWGAVVSPDATFVAYTSSRTGTFQVFVQPNPPTGQEWQVSSDFGEEPVWSRNSPELFFRRHNQWWSVSFAEGTPGPSKLLFEGPFFNAFGPSYDVAPDGRFLMALPPAADEATRELQWVDGWTQEASAKLSAAR